MLRVETLESRCLLSRYSLTDLGSFHGRAMNDWGLVAGLDAAGQPALWYGGQVIDLPSPAGLLNVVPNAVNDWGEAAGYGTLPDGSTNALFWDARGVIDLGPGAVASLNDLAQLAGQSDYRAAVWSPYRPPEVFGGSFAQALAVNDSGQATGNDGTRAFRWQAGALEDLSMPTPDGLSAQGAGIDGAGDIAGSEQHPDSFSEAAVWYADGRTITLGVPAGYLQSFAYSLNDHGQVVGVIEGQSASIRHAFLWDQTHGIQDLNDLTDTQGFTLYGAGTITDRGVVFASARPPEGGSPHSVILTPTKDTQDPWIGWALALQDQTTPFSSPAHVMGADATGTPSTSQFATPAPAGMVST